ncbi:winged helix DNA-binding protein [Sphingomonas sp.]|uniref:winged helix DNA-binding protein n=1 Tax=Sphingomonas sp. TaxID=28214 RepID=UPI001B03AC0A|nr:winged helix DNA-binding protein [Sphingomonas sp.]MBO9711914.1 winged helix DNA-binding protein [Sphingomonas sp.]
MFGTDSDTTYQRSLRALIVSDSAQDPELEEALRLAGVSVASVVSIEDAIGRLDSLAYTDLLLLECSDTPSPLLDPLLREAAGLIASGDAVIITTVSLKQLDLASDHLGVSSRLLCQPSLDERATAILEASQRELSRVHDTSREGRLRQVGQDLRRISETLAGLAHERGGPAGPPATAADVRAILRARRMRDEFFPAGLFPDPAWDMLLDLYATHLEEAKVTVSALCIASAVPATTALRWLEILESEGLVVRNPDTKDRRRIHVSLSDDGLARMRDYLAAGIR